MLPTLLSYRAIYFSACVLFTRSQRYTAEKCRASAQPQCTYYFGPFAGAQEAEVASIGFMEDLEGEFAQGINTKIDRHYQPALLTIKHDLLA